MMNHKIFLLSMISSVCLFNGTVSATRNNPIEEYQALSVSSDGLEEEYSITKDVSYYRNIKEAAIKVREIIAKNCYKYTFSYIGQHTFKGESKIPEDGTSMLITVEPLGAEEVKNKIFMVEVELNLKYIA